jgi:hypothetical protein
MRSELIDTIKIAVRAKVYGNLAIHNALDTDQNLYTITHVPTGKSVTTEIYNSEVAKDLVKLLNALDWSFTEQADLDKNYAQARAIINGYFDD